MKTNKKNMNEKIYSRNDMKRAMREFGDKFTNRLCNNLRGLESDMDWNDRKNLEMQYGKDKFCDFCELFLKSIISEIEYLNNIIKQENK